MTTVLVFGTFDIFHEGHKSLLKQAKKHGNRLVVVLSRDETVLYVKGRPPKNPESIRKQMLEDCVFVDEVRHGHKGDKYKIIKEVNPDVICLGYDQKHFTDGLKERLANMSLFPKIKRLKPYKPDVFKSSKLRASDQK